VNCLEQLCDIILNTQSDRLIIGNASCYTARLTAIKSGDGVTVHIRHVIDRCSQSASIVNADEIVYNN